MIASPAAPNSTGSGLPRAQVTSSSALLAAKAGCAAPAVQARDSAAHIGRHIKLRDLPFLFSVAKQGSMAKVAARLATTQPTGSQANADLEAAEGARLFDRSTQGVVLTPFGVVLLRSGTEAFDALRQGVRSIECLSTPGAGDV